MPNIHPFLTHFPVALLTISFVFDTLSILFKDDRLEHVGRWSQLVGTISLAATVVSGLVAKGELTVPATGEAFLETHQQIAFAVTALAAFLLLWRVSNRLLLPSTHRTAFLILSFASLALVWVGAWYGGVLVYRFGVGVQIVPK